MLEVDTTPEAQTQAHRAPALNAIVAEVPLFAREIFVPACKPLVASRDAGEVFHRRFQARYSLIARPDIDAVVPTIQSLHEDLHGVQLVRFSQEDAARLLINRNARDSGRVAGVEALRREGKTRERAPGSFILRRRYSAGKILTAARGKI